MQRWAREKATEIGAVWFKASDTWLAHFKKANQYASRKVTKHKGQSEVNQQEAVRQSIVDFRQEYANYSNYFPHRLIWNIDQTGFQYESANIRTMSKKGERDTILNVDDKNKMTQSYTAQPIITRDGRLLSPILLCMQEFSPRIQQDFNKLVEQYRNIAVVAIKSGKMSKELMLQWINTVLAPNVYKERTINETNELE